MLITWNVSPESIKPGFIISVTIFTVTLALDIFELFMYKSIKSGSSLYSPVFLTVTLIDCGSLPKESIDKISSFDFSNCDFITKERDEKLSKWKLSRWDAVLTTRWTLWNTAYFENKIPYDNIRINSWMVILRPNKNNFSWDYLLLFLNSQNFTTQIESFVSWSAQPQLPIRSLSQFKIPLPPIDIQQQIVTEIEKEQAMVESAKGLVDVFEGKVKERIGEVWGE